MLRNQSNFKLLFEEYFEAVYRFVYKYTADSNIARDITQDAFIRLYEKKECFDCVEKAKSFLYITAKNLFLDYLKHKKIEEKYISETLSEENPYNFLQEITYQETRRILLHAINKLPNQTQNIMLKAIEGKNNNEIAEEMNISINTLKTLKKGAYKTLRNLLDKQIFLLLLYISH